MLDVLEHHHQINTGNNLTNIDLNSGGTHNKILPPLVVQQQQQTEVSSSSNTTKLMLIKSRSLLKEGSLRFFKKFISQ